MSKKDDDMTHHGSKDKKHKKPLNKNINPVNKNKKIVNRNKKPVKKPKNLVIKNKRPVIKNKIPVIKNIIPVKNDIPNIIPNINDEPPMVAPAKKTRPVSPLIILSSNTGLKNITNDSAKSCNITKSSPELIKLFDEINSPLINKTYSKLEKNNIFALLNIIDKTYGKDDWAPIKNDRYDPDTDLLDIDKQQKNYKIMFDRFNPIPLTPPLLTPKEKVNISVEINSLNDLLGMIDDNPLIDNIEYNIDMIAMHRIKDDLKELQAMIGMQSLKDSIIDQIIYFVQNFHQINKTGEGDFMHTVIYGPPGTGKTEIAKIIGNIFAKLGILKEGTFKKVTRSDLVAGYLGQTARLTKKVILESLGGVLFIDEAYALGNNEKRDSFAKECIDTLCEALSDYKGTIMVIIAGYEQELKECFFSYNQGLESRFTWRFETGNYTPAELRQIFIKKINENGWSIDTEDEISIEWFEKNKEHFKYFGRDIEVLFSKTKIAHSKRVFCKNKECKTKINKEDLDKGLELFLKNTHTANKPEFNYNSMYV